MARLTLQRYDLLHHLFECDEIDPIALIDVWDGLAGHNWANAKQLMADD
jgi:hypothetical protein